MKEHAMSHDSTYCNILQFAAYAAPYAGNFMASLTALERSLKDSGRSVTYVLPIRAEACDWARAMQRDEGNVYFLPDGGFFACVRRLRRLLIDHRVGVMHVHFIRYREKLAALLACKTCGHRVRTVCHLHNHMHPPRSVLRALPHRFYFSAADAFICCSASVANGILQSGADKEKVFVAENAIDFTRLNVYTPVSRSALGLHENEPVALLFGFDYRRKGVDIAVKAVRLLREEQGLSIQLAISLSSRRDEVERAICAELSLHALPDWIRLLPPRNDIAAYYHLADVFLSPSREEGFCYALIEAAYCCVPVVASAIDAQRDLLLPESVFCQPDDPEDLARHIQTALLDGNDAEDLDARRARVIAAYSLERWSCEVRGVYDRLLNGDMRRNFTNP